MERQYPNIRIYAQLKPDEASLEHLLAVQAGLPKQERGYAVPARQLHLTLIHFGKVFEVYDRLRSTVPDLSYEQYEASLQGYIAASEAAMPMHPIVLQPAGFALFGDSHTTLVAAYEANRKIRAAHQTQYQLLVTFLGACGLQSPESFMKTDANFKYAPEPKPHITLYKNYGTALPGLALEPVSLTAMPTVYPPA